MSGKPVVFMILPFDDDFLALYDALKERFADTYEFINAGDLDTQQSIIKDIVVGIHSANVIIADLTGLNANVFYELGLAHAMNKKVIIITQDIDDLAFDIRSYRANEYSMLFYKITQLYAQLEKLLAGAISGNIPFGNPVSDYIQDEPKVIEQSVLPAISEAGVSLVDDTEDELDKGFLDYIAEIEESTGIMSAEIDAMRGDMEAMTTGIVDGTKEINKIQSSSVPSAAILIRNVYGRLSQPVNAFALQLKGHTSKISYNWGKIENSYLALLNDKKILTPGNLDGMKKSMVSLKVMQAAIRDTDEKMETFIKSLNTSMGIERRFTKAIISLIAELQNYLLMTGTMASSIDRIISISETIFD